ncbi:hypothetical protein C7974DRAFT_182061 [Boeremia exigua]|uniref:uncharacterized protein n=1 Tax=Boeremia exigua TaxID=749465 RepID=UPI001E8D4616|nr:uncharacterized protein C7974DRAFT_182061 [Boeremia exigua]KAH6629149.1 hypothetical protein C7974DRAFT_182061 [Boeremia exigua]
MAGTCCVCHARWRMGIHRCRCQVRWVFVLGIADVFWALQVRLHYGVHIVNITMKRVQDRGRCNCAIPCTSSLQLESEHPSISYEVHVSPHSRCRSRAVHHAFPRVLGLIPNATSPRPPYRATMRKHGQQVLLFQICSAEMLGIVRLQSGFRCSEFCPQRYPGLVSDVSLLESHPLGNDVRMAGERRARRGSFEWLCCPAASWVFRCTGCGIERHGVVGAGP